MPSMARGRTSVGGTIGTEADLLNPGPESCRQIELPSPVLDNDTLAKLVEINSNDALPGFRSVHIHGLYPVAEGGAGLRKALDDGHVAGAAFLIVSTLLSIIDRFRRR